jgi:hypothetical protein
VRNQPPQISVYCHGYRWVKLNLPSSPYAFMPCTVTALYRIAASLTGGRGVTSSNPCVFVRVHSHLVLPVP